MKKVILKLNVHDDRDKKKAMKAVSGLGVDSISMDMKDQKLTLTGDIDPVKIVAKLRKFCQADIVSVGPAKEPEKKGDGKKDGEKKGDDKKKDPKNDPPKPAPVPIFYYGYPQYYQQPYQHYQSSMTGYYKPVEEDPNGCMIC